MNNFLATSENNSPSNITHIYNSDNRERSLQVPKSLAKGNNGTKANDNQAKITFSTPTTSFANNDYINTKRLGYRRFRDASCDPSILRGNLNSDIIYSNNHIYDRIADAKTDNLAISNRSNESKKDLQFYSNRNGSYNGLNQITNSHQSLISKFVKIKPNITNSDSRQIIM